MKTINTVVAAMALSTLSFGVFAAEPVTASQAQNMNKIGVVSADERRIVETFMKLKNGGVVEFDAMSEELFSWAKKQISSGVGEK